MLPVLLLVTVPTHFEVCREQGEEVRAVMEESGRVMRATGELTRRLNSARADKDEKARPG